MPVVLVASFFLVVIRGNAEGAVQSTHMPAKVPAKKAAPKTIPKTLPKTAPIKNAQHAQKKSAKKLALTSAILAPKKPLVATLTSDRATVHYGLPEEALRVPLVTYTFTAGDAPLELTGVTIEQGGMSSLGIFEAVLVLDSSGEPIEEASLRADRRTRIPLEVAVAPRESYSITLAANTSDDLDAYDGQVPTLKIVALDASESIELPAFAVGLPVVASMKIGSLSATRGGEDPVGSRTVYVNDNAVRFGAIRLTASSEEDVELHGLAWRQAGSASGTDIQNVRAIINGTWHTAEVDGRDYAVSLSAPLRIARGTSVDVVLMGNIGTTGSNRTVRFDIPASDEIAARGVRTNYFVGVGVGGHASVSDESTFNTTDGTEDGDSIVPHFYRGSTFTISPGGATYIGR